MKNLFVCFAAVAVLFVMGCQENSITDQPTNESVNKDQSPAPYQHGFISLEAMLEDPYPVMNSFYIISGEIEYEHRVVSQNYISLHLLTNADLQYLCTVCSPSENDVRGAFISNDSEDYLVMTSSFTILEKSFTIQGREDGMVLKCKFLVTTGGIELNAMWLALPDNNVVATNQTNN
jgi:hypothetical protein